MGEVKSEVNLHGVPISYRLIIVVACILSSLRVRSGYVMMVNENKRKYS